MPLATQSRKEGTLDQLVMAWDLDIQPGSPRRLYSSHYDSQKLIEGKRWLQELKKQSDEEFEATYAALQAKHDSEDEKITSIKRLVMRNRRLEIINRIEKYRKPLNAPYGSIRFDPAIEAFRDQVTQIQSYEDYVADLRSLRRYWQSPEFRKMRDNANRRKRKAHRGHIKWTSGLLEEFPTLQVVHLQLASTPKIYANVDKAFATLRKQRESLLKQLRKGCSIFTGTVGYIWKIAYQPPAGFRLVMVLFFDPSQREGSAEDLAKEIGNFWINDITCNEGIALTQSFYREASQKNSNNCFSQSGSQLGLVCRDDPRQVELLQSLLHYLTVLDINGHYCPTGQKRLPRSQYHGDGPWRAKKFPSA